MKQFKIIFTAVIGLWVVYSCNSITSGGKGGGANKYLPPVDYVKWIQDKDNGIKKEKVIDDIVYEIQYKPYEYIVCMEERKEKLADSVVKKKVEEINDMQYYDLTISLNSGSGELLKYGVTAYDQYDKRIKYVSFDMQNDISLVEDGDTIPCSLFHFERVYDVAPYAKFLLGFAKGKKDSPQQSVIVFDDKLFNQGLIKMTYSHEEISNIPKLKTND